jgi:2-polyprenyl-3-methyl-5-hydroxy-6-metoxy-1,4-benzoquinol methylase
MKVRSLSKVLVTLVTLPIRRVKDAVLATRLGYSEISRGPSDAVLAYTLGLLPGMTRAAAMDTLGLAAAERGKVLDVGCGNGAFLARMKLLGWQCTGIETDPLAAQFARDSFGLNVREGTLGDAGFSDDSFDVVTLSHVIEHVHSPQDLLMQCRRVLKPGGKLVVLTPNILSLGHRIFGRAWRGLEPPRHLQSFHPNALRQVVERSQLRTLRISTESRMMRSIWYASRLIQRADEGRRSRNGLLDYLLAYTMQCVEGIACRFAADVGEEIILVATKPTARPTSQPLEQ